MDIQSWYAKGTTFVSGDTSVFYVREGKGIPLVCIHGFPTSSWDFATVLPELAKQFDCIVPDLPGLGISTIPMSKDIIMNQTDAVELLLDDLGITEAHIFAHDIGDTIVQELLARKKEQKAKVKWLSAVFMNGGMFPEVNRPRIIQKLLGSFMGPFFGRFLSSSTYYNTMNNIFSQAHPPSKVFLESSWNLLLNNDGRKMIPVISQYLEERRTHIKRWRSPLQHPEIPMAMINGIEDPISGLGTAQFFQKLQPQSLTVFIENSGHYPHVETPEAVLTSFFEFHKSL